MTEPRGPLGRGLDRIVGTVAPSVVDAVDVEAVLERIDLDELVGRIDLDALLATVDLEALLARLDLDTVLRRIDVGALIATVDVDALIQRVDVDGLIQRVDVDGLIQRVDVDGLIQRVDVDGLIQRVDVDGLVGRIDLNPLLASVDLEPVLAKVDVAALAERADIGTLVTQSSQKVAGSALDLARRQLVGLDLVVGRPFVRMGRGPATPGPAALVPPEDAGDEVRHRVSGQYAGPIARFAAFAADSAFIAMTFALIVSALSFLIDLFTGVDSDPTDTRGLWWTLGLAVWAGTYSFVSLVVTGRTPGKGLVGLRVVDRQGHPLRPPAALARVITFPFSFAFFGIGFIGLLIGKERRAFHDVCASTTVVYDWGDRQAEMPGPLARFLARRTDVVG